MLFSHLSRAEISIDDRCWQTTTINRATGNIAVSSSIERRPSERCARPHLRMFSTLRGQLNHALVGKNGSWNCETAE
jgi:hypothetical protein